MIHSLELSLLIWAEEGEEEEAISLMPSPIVLTPSFFHHSKDFFPTSSIRRSILYL